MSSSRRSQKLSIVSWKQEANEANFGSSKNLLSSNKREGSKEILEAALRNIKKDGLHATHKKEENKDSVPTIEETEHRALVNCILSIMRRTYERLQVALVIPYVLTNDEEIVDQYVSANDKQALIEMCNKYLQYEDKTPLNKKEKGVYVDNELVKAVDLLHSNDPFLKNICPLVNNLPESSKKFLKAINDLKLLAEIRLKTTAEEEIQKEKMLHHIFQENLKLQGEIKKMKSNIRERSISKQWKVAAKQAVVQKYKNDLVAKKLYNEILIQKEIVAANKNMDQIRARSEDRQHALNEAAIKAKQSYEKLIQDNMRADKKLREKKARILTQLTGWIKKYDNDVGERSREIERLQAEFKEKTEEFNQFMELYEKQESEFNALAAMREAEEKKIQKEKILLFMMNRAARRIQARWRMFRQKKKKPKGKGKKAKK